MFKAGLRPQFNGDNQGQGDGSDPDWSNGDNQVQSDGFDSSGPAGAPAYATDAGVFAAGTGSSGSGVSTGAGSGAGSGASTIVSNGGNLIFNNTYDATCTAAYENCIVAAELTLESLFAPSLNKVTINVTFNMQSYGAVFALDNVPTGGGTNVSYATLKSALVATGEGDLLPATDPSGGGSWFVPSAYARMLGISASAPSTDVTVNLNTYYSWDFTQDVVNGLEHELSELSMGRIGGLGGTGGGPYTGAGTGWDMMDLFRYSAANTPDYANGRDGATTYFSSNGTTLSSSAGLSFNNQFNGNGTLNNKGDTDDWVQQAVFGSTGGGESLTLVQTELNVMQALGWNIRMQEDFWVGGNGNWWTVNTSDWSAGSTGTDYVPITPQDAFIGFFNTATVTSSNNETVNSIGTNVPSTLIIANDSTLTATNGTVLNPADIGTTVSGLLGTLDVDPGSTLVIGNTFDNAGTLTLGVNSGGGGNGTLQILGSVTLNGSGTVNLGQYSNQTFSTGTIETYPGPTMFFVNGALTNVNNTIVGGGTIGLYSFDNQAAGTVEASQSEGYYLQVYGTHSFTNEGEMIADNRATLDLGQDGATETLTNTGSTGANPSKGIYLDSDGDLAISGNLTIAGAGDIGMKGAGADIVSDGQGAATFTNESTIGAFASGQIGDVGVLGVNDLTFDNDDGTVLVDGSGNVLTLNTGSHTITDNEGGLFEAEDSAQMVIDSNVNTGGTSFVIGHPGGGTIEAAAGSKVTIAAAIAPGGSGLFFYDGEVLISGNGTIDLAGGGSIATPITFSGSGGTLQVDSAADSVTGQISGFAAGDYIDARFMPFTSKVTAQWVENGAGTAGTLTLSNGGGTSMTFNINGDFLPFFNFQVSSDGRGGTRVTLQNPNPSVPAGTDDVMIMTGAGSRDYEIYDLGGNALLAGYLLGQAAPPWTFVGLGGFNGSDTADMILRAASGPSAGAFEVYDISNNNVTNAAALGTIGLEWTVAGFGDFSSNPGETDMLLRNSSTGAFEIYDIHNNAITSAASMGTIGLEWTVAGFGDFSSNPGETDTLMRNSSTGAFEVYDISHNALTSAASMGAVGAPWTVAGFGDFSSNPGESDMLMRNSSTGAFEVYDISHNALTSAASMGSVGLEWTVAGFGDLSGKPNETDMLLRNGNTGAFEVYDISHNAITSAASMGSVGLEWTVDGIAADPPSGASGASMGPLLQAMAGLPSAAAALDQGALNQATADATSPPSLAAASPLVHPH